MNIEQLKGFIYNQRYAAVIYLSIAEIAPDETTKKTLKNFAADCNNNASYLDRFYQEEMTSSFDPIVPKAPNLGSFKESTLWMLRFESDTYRKFMLASYNLVSTNEYLELLGFIANVSNGHAHTLTNMYLSN